MFTLPLQSIYYVIASLFDCLCGGQGREEGVVETGVVNICCNKEENSCELISLLIKQVSVRVSSTAQLLAGSVTVKKWRHCCPLAPGNRGQFSGPRHSYHVTRRNCHPELLASHHHHPTLWYTLCTSSVSSCPLQFLGRSQPANRL